MKRYFLYLIVYSVCGFILERIINILFYQEYIDNSVLIGPYQPLYGTGIVMAIIINDLFIAKYVKTHLLRLLTLLLFAVLTTAVSEAVTGYGYEALTGVTLWDYREFFPCQSPYVCVIPTTIFGIISMGVILFIHPLLKPILQQIPNVVVFGIAVIFIADVISTLFIII